MISVTGLLIRSCMLALLCSSLFFTEAIAQEKLPPRTKSGFVVTLRWRKDSLL